MLFARDHRWCDGPQSCVAFNFMLYILPFFIGLNWTHFQSLPFIDGISLSPQGMRKLRANKAALGALLPIMAFSAVALVVHVALLWQTAYFGWYVGWTALVVAGMSVVTFMLRRSHHIHVHHFFLCSMLLPYTGFCNPISAVCQGLLAGVYVEGVARFGMGYYVDQWNDNEVGFRTQWGLCCVGPFD